LQSDLYPAAEIEPRAFDHTGADAGVEGWPRSINLGDFSGSGAPQRFEQSQRALQGTLVANLSELAAKLPRCGQTGALITGGPNSFNPEPVGIWQTNACEEKSLTAAVVLRLISRPGFDEDDDGVEDDIDSCEQTPPVEPVDTDGCSESQKDDDLDGVANANDQCPATTEGALVDGNGCSDSQRDDDGDGVANITDSCPDTPAEEAVDSDGCSESQIDPEAAVRQVYEDDVNSLIVSAEGGCTSSGCHGRAGAPGGLSLYREGILQLGNYSNLRDYIGRNLSQRLLTKLSGGLGHGGGIRFAVGSAEFNLISAWALSVENLP